MWTPSVLETINPELAETGIYDDLIFDIFLNMREKGNLNKKPQAIPASKRGQDNP